MHPSLHIVACTSINLVVGFIVVFILVMNPKPKQCGSMDSLNIAEPCSIFVFRDFATTS